MSISKQIDMKHSVSVPVADAASTTRFRDYVLIFPNVMVRVANTMSTSILPLLLVSLAFPVSSVGWIVSFGGLTTMIVGLVGGVFSDYFNKKTVGNGGRSGRWRGNSLAVDRENRIRIHWIETFSGNIYRCFPADLAGARL
jgi:hypothetical protein